MEPDKEIDLDEVEEVKPKARARRVKHVEENVLEDSQRDALEKARFVMKDMRAALVADVDYDVTRIGGDRLRRYSMYTELLEALNDRLRDF